MTYESKVYMLIGKQMAGTITPAEFWEEMINIAQNYDQLEILYEKLKVENMKLFADEQFRKLRDGKQKLR